jgi:hypothetical protein
MVPTELLPYAARGKSLMHLPTAAFQWPRQHAHLTRRMVGSWQ